MSKLRLHGTSSGYTDIAPTAAAGNNTLTAPTGTGTLVAKDAAGAIGITSVQATNANFSGTTRITSGISTTLRVTTGISTTLQVGGVNVLNSDGVNTSGIVTAKAFVPTAQPYGTKNLLHNGGMMVWQRATSVATQDGTNEGYQSVDGYYNSFVGSANGAYTISKSTEAPDGFNSSIKYDVTTVNSNDSDGNRTIYIWQNIEAQNVVNSGWKPTSTSSYLTFSFYFKTNKSGTNKLAVHLTEHGNAYSYVTDITVSDTNWNRYSVTVPGHASITIPNDNTGGLKVGMAWVVSPGFETSDTDQWVNSREYGTSNSTNWFDNTSNEWYTTGWQVEVGSHVTPFEHRSYGDELLRCQRYYQRWTDGYLAGNSQGADINIGVPLAVPLRAAPTVAGLAMHRSGNQSVTVGIVQIGYTDVNSTVVRVRTNNWTSMSDETVYTITPSSDTMELTAEL